MNKLFINMLRKTFLIATFSVCTLALFAQGIQVTGTVADTKGESLPGATVVVKGTTQGTVADADGKFSITVPSEESVLVFSSVGYTTQEITVGSQRVINPQLAEGVELEEVVVTGMGISREAKALGYAMTTIKADELTKVGTPNFASALYGKAPGVRIQSSTGNNTSSVAITVRGLSSLTGNTQPLLVLDGVPVRNGNANNDGSWDGGRIYSNGIVDINPEDIESISILKGAAASALYGSEAANGVILVNSKKGTGEKGIGVDFNATWQVNTVAYMPKVQDEYGPGRPVQQRYNDYQKFTGFGLDQMTFRRDPNDPSTEGTYEFPFLLSSFSYGPKYDGREVLYWDRKTRPYNAITDSPFSDLFKNGFNQTYNLAVTKTTDKSSARFSYTFVKDDPNQFNSDYSKHNFNLNGNLGITPTIKVGYSANLVRQNVKNRPKTVGGMINNMSNQFHSFDDLKTLRDIVITSQGYRNVNEGDKHTLTPSESYAFDNPTDAKSYYWDALANQQLETNTRLIASVAPQWEIIPGLTVRGRLSTDLTVSTIERKSRTEYPHSTLLDWTNKTGGYLARNENYDIYYGDIMLLFNRNLTEKLGMTANVGFSGRQEKSLVTQVQTVDGLSVENWFNLAASVRYNNSNPNMSTSELLKTAYFGTLGLSYNNYLFIEGTIRQEKTSTLATGHNTFWYPSVNVSFLYSEAFKDGLPTWWSYGKARVSYGVVGNAPDIYRANVAYNQSSMNGIPYNQIPAGVGNDALRPETKYEWEFGLENKLFNNRIGLEVSYYTNKVEDQILPVTTTQSVGGTSLLQNIGTLQNSGLEVAFNARPIESSDFDWDVWVNYSFNRGKVLKLAGGDDVLQHGDFDQNMGGSVRVQSIVGEQMGDIMAYVPLTDEQGRYLINPNADNLYMITYDETGLKKIGNAIPKAVGGFGSTLRYKNFFFDFTIDYRIGGYIVSDGYQYTMARGIHPETLAHRDEEHGGIPYYFKNNSFATSDIVKVEAGTTTGPNGETVYHNGMIVPGVIGDPATRTSTGKENDGIVPADRYYNYVYNVGNEEPTTFMNAIFDNSYMKMREMSLSYSLPTSLTSKFKCKNLTLSVFGRNLFYFFKNKSGYDPESTAGTSWTRGIFVGTQTSASTRTFGVSLRASF